MILITTYQQYNLVKQNIENFRNNFKGFLSKAPIVVVTTSEEDIGFNKLTKDFNDVYVINFNDAPGSSTCKWYNFKQECWTPRSWKHEFISPRIFISMSKGLNLCESIGGEKVLHLHSDTFWDHKHEEYVNDRFDELDNFMLMGDRSIADCNSGPLPRGFHLHPEGLFFNLKQCRQYNNYGFSYDLMFTNNTTFESHNFYSPEALIGQYAYWCLTGKNILDSTEEVDPIYFEKVKILCSRTYHGTFDNGIINLAKGQPEGK